MKSKSCFKTKHKCKCTKRGKPNFDLDVTYYHYSNINVGERYFKVKPNEPVLQIISSAQKKKGRSFTIGVTYITYKTFIGSWGLKKSGWRLGVNGNIKTISKIRFDAVLEKMIKNLANQKK